MWGTSGPQSLETPWPEPWSTAGWMLCASTMWCAHMPVTIVFVVVVVVLDGIPVLLLSRVWFQLHFPFFCGYECDFDCYSRSSWFCRF
jgi:hypothetical protein